METRQSFDAESVKNRGTEEYASNLWILTSRCVKYLQSSKRKLISKTNSHLRMLEHVVVAHCSNCISRGVNHGAGVGERGFDDESRWISGLRCTGVV